MRSLRYLMVVVGVGLLAVPASAATLSGSGSLSSVPDGAGWDYSITLKDTGTTDIGTFWYSWKPGEGFLFSQPTKLVTPAGWTAMVTNGPPNDGYSVQFVAGAGAALTPGSSLSGFGFTSADSPAALAGNSLFNGNPPVGTSTIYTGAPFSSSPSFLVVSSAAAAVPEPSTLILGVFGVLASIPYLRHRRISAA